VAAIDRERVIRDYRLKAFEPAAGRPDAFSINHQQSPINNHSTIKNRDNQQ
jgi:hypothetical protein